MWQPARAVIDRALGGAQQATDDSRVQHSSPSPYPSPPSTGARGPEAAANFHSESKRIPNGAGWLVADCRAGGRALE